MFRNKLVRDVQSGELKFIGTLRNEASRCNIGKLFSLLRAGVSLWCAMAISSVMGAFRFGIAVKSAQLSPRKLRNHLRVPLFFQRLHFFFEGCGGVLWEDGAFFL